MSLIVRVKLLLAKVGIFSTAVQTAMAAEMGPAMEASVLVLQREIASRTPVGATGILRGSIQGEVRGSAAQLRGVVATSQAHALPVETGSRPHWAPIRPLLLWATRKLGNPRAAYAVRRNIHLRGTKGHHMFRDGVIAARPRIQQFFAQAVAKVHTRLGG